MSYKLIESTPAPSFKRFVQRSLGLDLVKGLGITLKEFFTPSTIATIKYPLEKIPLSPRYRAIHKLMRLLESGEERCIGCGLCEKICISNCIKIETGYGDDGRKRIDSYTINFGRCIYCGFCAEVCPEIAIIHGERYENSAEQRAHFANKGVMLTPLDLALRGNIDEFAGFGSLREEADECVKQTPTGYVGNSPSGLHSADFGIFGASQTSSLVSAPKIPKNHESQTENPSVVDSANPQNLGENGAKNAESATFCHSTTICHSERSEESQKKNNRDSSPTAQNDNFKDFAESSLDSTNQIKNAESNAIKDTKC